MNEATFRQQFQRWIAAEQPTFETGKGAFLEDECLHLFSTLALTAGLTIYRSKRSADTFKDGSKAVTKQTALGYTGLSRDNLRQQFGNGYAKYIEFLRTHNYLQVYEFYDKEGLISTGDDLFGVAPVKRNYSYKAKGHKKANTGSYIGKNSSSSEQGMPKHYRLHNDHALPTENGSFDVLYSVEMGPKYSHKAHRYYTKLKDQTLARRAGFPKHRQVLAEYVDTLVRNVDFEDMEAWLRTTTDQMQDMPPVWSLYYVDLLRQGIIQYENLSCGFGHRLHTPLTNIATELRRFFKVDGSPVASLDIRCSQFVLASYLFEYPEQCYQLLTADGDMPTATVSYVLDTLHAAYNADPKIRQYCHDVRTQDLYAHTAAELGLSDRGTGKNLWFGAFFSMPGEFEHTKQKLRPLYGTLLDVTSALNGPGEGDTEKRNLMPMMLQRLEQQLIIEGVAARLLDAGIGPFATIHDSIHTNATSVDAVISALQATYTDAGLPVPTFKVETEDEQGAFIKQLIEPAAALVAVQASIEVIVANP
ncbi:hypothetical protein F0P96_18565 [Hymenobacter busanensis]|uniref:Uncharacterized protein n=1 Tax=Hymenobacter busanensis TaxID=2607656 RepID=A0A7L4ZRU7_9BACT|nr:hypothetical protein [Hymenobacter busanensis]KAA9327237.1 hypothetical protein F0P96_18565 [Hymenobacter busanensis]QHJ05904.1 hypothetical protein GUY19_00775 [Hymenobacter busanensis]